MDTAAPPLPDPSPADRLQFGPFVLDLAAGRLLRDGQAVELGPKSWDLLVFLATRPGRLVSKTDLLDGVWGHRHVSESALKVAINGLRNVLGDDARAPRWIQTEPRRGYRFSAEADVDAASKSRPQQAAADALPTRGNLPTLGAPLLGRDVERAELQAALKSHRLVTITGPGGVGKTRLALDVAGHAPPRDGVWLVRLESISGNEALDAALAPALARTLGLSEAAGRDLAALTRALGPLQLRLLLDNAEHMADGLAAAVSAWLQAAPGLQVLVTSQRPLHLTQEQVLPLQPLAPGTAVALLVQRVRITLPQWTPQAEELADLHAIARGLDALPLALELAAARVPLLGTQGVRQRLDERLQMLTRGAQDAPTRHRTLRAALEWSVGLLPQAATLVLERLSVFVGGFTLEAAREVAAGAVPDLDEWAVLDALDLLHDMALLVREKPRMRLYDSVRVLAAERLAARGDGLAAQAAHMAWMTRVLAHAHGRVNTVSEADWLAPIEAEIENLQAAMARGLTAAQQSASHLPALLALFCVSPLFCIRTGLKRQLLGWWQSVRELKDDGAARDVAQAFAAPVDAAFGLMASPGQLVSPAEGLAALTRALTAGGTWLTSELHLYLLYHVGHLQHRLNLIEDLAHTHRLAADLVRPDSTVYGRRSVTWLGALLSMDCGDVRAYADFWAQLLAESRQRGDRLESWRAAWGLAQTLYLQDQLDAAVASVDEAVDQIRQAGRLRGYGALLAQGAMLRLARDASPTTLERVHEALEILRADGMVWWLADALAWVPLWQGRMADALRVQAWADGLVAARKEQRGPVFGKLRAAFEARTAGQPATQGPPLTEASALQLVLGASRQEPA